VFAVFGFFTVPLHIKRRLLFNRERAAGYYGVASYSLSHLLCTLPLNMVVCLSYTLILYRLQSWDGDLWFALLINALLMQTCVLLLGAKV